MKAIALIAGPLVVAGAVISPVPSIAEDRAPCSGNADPKGVVVAVDGIVNARAASGEAFPVSVGMPLCARDEITTGARSRVEFRLAGRRTTTGSSSNSVTLIPDSDSGCVELRDGIIAFISSVVGTHCVRTPFLDAGIDGTEAVIAVDGPSGDSFVLVREGIVSVSDRRGTTDNGLKLTADEGGPGRAAFATGAQRLVIATPENVPAKFRELLLRPDDATDWAIYYPPVLLASGVSNPTVREAAALIDAGEIDAAEDLLVGSRFGDRDRAAALALRTIAAVQRNQVGAGLALADEAVAMAPELAAAHVARSYAHQASGDLEAARADASRAVEVQPDDAYAWARLAELHLTIGARRDARRAIEKSLSLSETALGRTIEGFAALASNDFDAAETALQRAIELDSEAPLPRLGLGLGAIRRGDLEAGRLEIETAVALDPRRASLRVWLGRAYFEEGLLEKAAAQFALAKEEDPEDPNAYLFDAIRLFRQNRPVEALRAIEAAQAVGDARSVVRSEAGLGEDRAVRSAATGRVFDVLGFEGPLKVAGGEAVDEDPANPEAHRVLADSARTDPDREITRVSERLKANLLAPPSKTPLQPHLGEINLALLETSGPTRVTFAEYGPLFDSDGFRFDISGFGGSQDTFGYEASLTGLHDNVSIALGGFLFDTAGFGVNNDLAHQIYSAQLKYQPVPEFTLFAEVGRRDTEGGDRRIDVLPARPRSDNLRVDLRDDHFRIGGRFEPSERVTVIGYVEGAAREADFTETVMGLTTRFDGDQDGYKVEGLALVDLDPMSIQLGAEYSQIEFDDVVGLSFGPFPFPPLIVDGSVEFWRIHGSVDLTFPSIVTWTAGFAYERYEEKGGAAPFTVAELQPKLALKIRPANGVALRAAYSESLTRPSLFPETLERTTLAGFDQFFDDAPGIEYRSLSGGIDIGPFHGVRAGAGAEVVDVILPDRGAGASGAEIVTIGGYLSADLWSFASVSFEPEWETSTSTAFLQADELDTLLLPLKGSFHHPSGLFATTTLTWYDQKGVDSGAVFKDNGLVVDAAIGFRLPDGLGVFTIEALNLFDTDIALSERDGALSASNFGNVLFNTPRFAPDLSVMATLTLRL